VSGTSARITHAIRSARTHATANETRLYPEMNYISVLSQKVH